MAAPTGSSDARADDPSAPVENATVPPEEPTGVSIHSTDPDRALFIEEDNPDGWIATDLTVELQR